jgi:RNA polymerase sigma-70 factor (ECF subfamily)
MGKKREKRPSDAELVRRCLKGEEKSWELLLVRYRRMMFHIAYQFVGRVGEAEDLVQEIFLKLTHSLEKFDIGSNLGKWLYRVARNYCIDYYRKKRKEREWMVGEGGLMVELASSLPSQFLSVKRKEQILMLKQAIGGLPEPIRVCLALREFEGLSYLEIARKLDIPLGTVKSRINRGRSELLKLFGEQGAGRG